MMTQESINWKAEVDKIKDDLLDDLNHLLSINSIRDDEAATEEFPVGPGPVEALDAFLEIAERDGFQTEKFDNWAGHIDMGEGEETLGILAHVDVVPEGSGWETDPFEPTIQDNRLYARGSSDDKGPGMAAYYAMKIVRELGVDLSKKVRFIIGTDEESDWQCMDHYFLVNDQPELGFSPDASFPIINGEKGNVSIYMDFSAETVASGRRLISFQSGLRENMVPQDAESLIQVEDAADGEALVQAFHNYADAHPIQVEVEENKDEIRLAVIGKASHGAHPENGENAGTYLADFLSQASLGGDGAHFVQFIADKLHDDPFAAKTELKIEDEVMGELTMNIGIMTYAEGEGGHVVANFRYPQNIAADEIEQKFKQVASEGMTIAQGDDKEPHYVPGDDPLVQTLLEVYERQTGEEGHEVVIGGGTYARTIERGVAYGAMFPHSEDTMHQANEYIDLDDLFNATAIYAEAIYELAK